MAEKLTAQEKARRAARVALYAKTLAARDGKAVIVPKQYRKRGRPAFRVSGKYHGARTGKPTQAAPTALPNWYAAMADGRMVSAWDRRQHKVRKALKEYAAARPDANPELMFMVRKASATRPTRATTTEG